MKVVNHKGGHYRIHLDKYTNGDRTSLQLFDIETGELAYTCTVNVPEMPLMNHMVIIKDYSENEGILKSLVKALIVQPTGQTIAMGFVEGHICHLLINKSL